MVMTKLLLRRICIIKLKVHRVEFASSPPELNSGSRPESPWTTVFGTSLIITESIYDVVSEPKFLLCAVIW